MMKKKAKISIIFFTVLISMSSFYILHAQFTSLFQGGMVQSLKNARMRTCLFSGKKCTDLEQKLKSIADKVNAIKDKTTKKASTILASATAFLKTPEVIACKKFGACSSLSKWLIRSIEAVLVVAGVMGIGWYFKGKKREIPEEPFDVLTAEKELDLLDSNIEYLERAIDGQNKIEIKRSADVLMNSLWDLSNFPDISEGLEEITEIELLKNEIETSERFLDMAQQIVEKAKIVVFWIAAAIAEKKTKTKRKEFEEYLELEGE